MRFKVFGAALFAAGSPGRFRRARTDGNPVVALDGRRAGRKAQCPRDQVQREPDPIQGRARLQGQLSRVDDRRDRGLPRGQRAASAAGVRGRHGDDDGRQGGHRAGHQGDGRRERAVRPQVLHAGGRGLLHRQQGQHAVVPVQQLDRRPVHQPRRVQEGGAQSRPGAEDVEGHERRGAAAQGQGPGLRLHVRLAVLDAHRELQRLAQRADRHERQRHGGHGHGVHHQFAAAREASDDAGRDVQEGPLHLRRAHQPGRSEVRERRVRDADVLHRRAGQLPRERQARLVGELHSLSRRRGGCAAEFDHRRRVRLGDVRQEARRLQGRGEVLRVPVEARDPDGMAHRHRVRAHHDGRLRHDAQVRLLRQESRRRHRGQAADQQAAHRRTPRACASAITCRGARSSRRRWRTSSPARRTPRRRSTMP